MSNMLFSKTNHWPDLIKSIIGQLMQHVET